MLTSKQRAHLRSIAQSYDTIFQIGKFGLSDQTVQTVSDALEARELIKLRTLETCAYTPREAAEALAEACGAEVVCVTGSRFVLWRRSSKEKNRKIEP